LQVAANTMPVSSLIIGVDLVPIKPVRGAKTIIADITTPQCRQLIKKEAAGSMFDVVVHDGAPNVGGAWASEAYTQVRRWGVHGGVHWGPRSVERDTVQHVALELHPQSARQRTDEVWLQTVVQDDNTVHPREACVDAAAATWGDPKNARQASASPRLCSIHGAACALPQLLQGLGHSYSVAPGC
jgi:hypothetical protein